MWLLASRPETQLPPKALVSLEHRDCPPARRGSDAAGERLAGVLAKVDAEIGKNAAQNCAGVEFLSATAFRGITAGKLTQGHPRGGVQSKSKGTTRCKANCHALQPEMRSTEEIQREALPVASDDERPLSDARGKVAGSAEGE
jgi:hypothetical protein